jgi:hypothetical protein
MAPLRVGDLTLNPDTHEVARADRQIDLTQREFELLEYLMRNERLGDQPTEAARRGLGAMTLLDHEHDRGLRVQPEEKLEAGGGTSSPPHGPRRGYVLRV